MSFLESIITAKREEIKNLKKKYTISDFRDFENYEIETRDFRDAICRKERLGLIAEIKKASPSRGIIRDKFNPGSIYDDYSSSGVDAVSILTEKNFFLGDTSYITELSGRSAIPVLRKDFILDPIQIYESKGLGADAVLLISEILLKEEIRELTLTAHELGLSVLLELHSIEELEKTDPELNNIIGINNRDLKTFSTDIGVSEKISEYLPEDVTIVSESGIKNEKDLTRLKKKVDAVLVGELFMEQEDLSSAVSRFLKWCKYES